MRKYTKTGEKRYSVLSRKGYYTKPVLIHETVERSKRPVNLAGKVLKPHKPLMTPQNATNARAQVLEYIRELRKAGVPVHPTKIVVIPTKRKGRVQLNFIQEQIPRNFILNNYLKHCTRQEAISIFSQTLQIFKKLEQTPRPGVVLGIDSDTRNLAVVNGKVVLIDVYPPFIRNKTNLSAWETVRELRNPLIRKIAKTFPRFATRQAKKIIDWRFDNDRRTKRLLRHFLKERPELKQELEKLIG